MVNVHIHLSNLLFVFADRGFQIFSVRLCVQHRHQRLQRFAHIAPNSEIEPASPSQTVNPDVDLRDLALRRQEFVVWKISAQEDQKVAFVDRLVSHPESNQTGHSHVIRIVVFDERLSSVGMRSRSFNFLRESDDLIVSVFASNSAEERHFLTGVDQLRQTRQVLFTGTDAWPATDQRPRCPLGGHIRTTYVAGQHDHAYPAFSKCALHRDVKHALELLRVRNQLAIVAAFLEQDFRVGLLKISRADLTRGNMRGDRKHRSIASMSVEKAVDQVQVARAAASPAAGELAGELCLRAGRIRAGFFVAHMDPFNFGVQP